MDDGHGAPSDSSSEPSRGFAEPTAGTGPGRARFAVRLRRFAILWHRYVGLAISGVILVAGVTGVPLAFEEELDAWLNPELFEAHPETPGRAMLSPFEVRRRALPQLPEGMKLRSVRFAVEPGHAAKVFAKDENGLYRQWFLDPYTGEVLGSRSWGDISEGMKNLMPFIYRLHYSLGLGIAGAAVFGLAAFLWTFDCFFAMYLTFPPPRKEGSEAKRRSWVSRWKPAWLVKATKLFSFVFTWHRASGLWIWGFLLIFAWSAVSVNLPPVYRPIMNAILGMEVVGHESLPQLEPPFPEPKLTLEAALERGEAEMAREASERGFEVGAPQQIYWAADHGVYGYVVESSLDISLKRPWTEVYIDGQTGDFVGFTAPTGIAAGNTFSSWILALHMGVVFGTWYRVVVALMGVLVSVLSVTGVWVWWKKRTRRTSRPKP